MIYTPTCLDSAIGALQESRRMNAEKTVEINELKADITKLVLRCYGVSADLDLLEIGPKPDGNEIAVALDKLAKQLRDAVKAVGR